MKTRARPRIATWSLLILVLLSFSWQSSARDHRVNTDINGNRVESDEFGKLVQMILDAKM